MALWDQVARFLALAPEPMRERSILFETNALPLEEQIIAYRRRRLGSSPWTPPSIRQALGVPAVFGMVSTIANTIGTLSLEAFRNGVKLRPEDRPSLIVRPDPFRRPGSFFRDSAWNLATRGEAWWWVAKRDPGDSNAALSLINISPTEVTVTENPKNRLRPIITWHRADGDVEMPNEDMRQITYVREPGDLRGKGPLQMCGAAVSVAVESQEWAANFYAEGGNPSVIIKAAGRLGATQDIEDPDDADAAAMSEAEALRAQWVDSPNNVPRIIDEGIESVDYKDVNQTSSQMLEGRDFQVGEMARAFSYPMSLIGFAVEGSSLTYQNVGQELDKLTRTCLIPHYLEKFEQEMSDLLTRSTTCEFNIERLLRADIKTRYDVYGIAVDKQILTAEEIRNIEGYGIGDVETAPVPFAPPRAIPTQLPIQSRSLAVTEEVRCPHCRKLVIESATRPYKGTCPNPKCKREFEAA